MEKWQIKSYIVTFGEGGERMERIPNEIPAQELCEMGEKMNRRALQAAGYKEVA